MALALVATIVTMTACDHPRYGSGSAERDQPLTPTIAVSARGDVTAVVWAAQRTGDVVHDSVHMRIVEPGVQRDAQVDAGQPAAIDSQIAALADDKGNFQIAWQDRGIGHGEERRFSLRTAAVARGGRVVDRRRFDGVFEHPALTRSANGQLLLVARSAAGIVSHDLDAATHDGWRSISGPTEIVDGPWASETDGDVLWVAALKRTRVLMHARIGSGVKPQPLTRLGAAAELVSLGFGNDGRMLVAAWATLGSDGEPHVTIGRWALQRPAARASGPITVLGVRPRVAITDDGKLVMAWQGRGSHDRHLLVADSAHRLEALRRARSLGTIADEAPFDVAYGKHGYAVAWASSDAIQVVCGGDVMTSVTASRRPVRELRVATASGGRILVAWTETGRGGVHTATVDADSC